MEILTREEWPRLMAVSEGVMQYSARTGLLVSGEAWEYWSETERYNLGLAASAYVTCVSYSEARGMLLDMPWAEIYELEAWQVDREDDRVGMEGRGADRDAAL